MPPLWSPIRFFARAATRWRHPVVVGHLAGCPLGCVVVGFIEHGWQPWLVGVGLVAGLLGGGWLAAMLCVLLTLIDDQRRELRRLRR